MTTEKQKVLIVDDEPRNQRIIAETLEGIVDMKLASSGEEALTIAETYMPDLLLLDIMMPGIDGYEACRKIKGNPKFNLTKVILVSGKAMIEERLKGYDCGADDYMTKPFVAEELLAKSKVFLRLTQAEKQFLELNHSLDEKVKERTKQLVDAEAKLVNSEKMKALGEMAGGIAREINTPLGTITLLTEQLQDLVNGEPLDKKSAADALQLIDNTVKRISTIVQGLRTFSRDGSQDRPDVIQVAQIIESTLVLCKEKLKMNDIQIKLEAISNELSVLCRPVQISQVLVNLINNAFDAIVKQEDKWIQIAAKKEGDMVEISVTDSGNGIPENVQKKLFQPFFTTKEIGKGTGLGLSISKGIVEAHNGTLDIDNNCKNTRFLLRIPTKAAA